jgi:predicted NAD/FAD-binding protein
MKVAVVGNRIFDLGAAWFLNRKHDGRLFEKRAGPSVHTNTIVHDMDGCELFLARSGRGGR